MVNCNYAKKKIKLQRVQAVNFLSKQYSPKNDNIYTPDNKAKLSNTCGLQKNVTLVVQHHHKFFFLAKEYMRTLNY